MLDINRHRFFLVQLLKDIYSDRELANYLGFKGGTAQMMFYDLPRFSIDLDFDLLNADKEKIVYEKVRKIILSYGSIHDEASKFYGPLLVLDYGVDERKLKVEISNRMFDSRYEIRNYLGINMQVMVVADMFAHKLCAFLDRDSSTNRDIFDIWFFLQRQTPVNTKMIVSRMKTPYEEYIGKCISRLESMDGKHLLDGLGELMTADLKKFVRARLLSETLSLLRYYQKFPISQ
jgi:predicted nucleotidyltransferase component of viral defense system